jgi:hypothetical protein
MGGRIFAISISSVGWMTLSLANTAYGKARMSDQIIIIFL